MIKSQEFTSKFKSDIDLDKEFEDSLKNEEFKSFIEKFKVSRDELVKNTSSLEKSACEYNNCLNCKGLNECCNEIKGFAYLPKVENGNMLFRYKGCRYYEKNKKTSEHLKYVKSYHMPLSVVEAKWSEIKKNSADRKETLLWLTDFKNEYPNARKGLYLYGSFGGGKSYLITAMFNELAKSKVRSTIVFFSEFLQELKSSFDTDFSDRILNLKKTPLLLIDDIGSENMTAWARDEILCPILQYRMDEKLPTFFTSNLDLESLEQHLSNDGKEVIKAKRIISRIKQLCDVIEMNSTNMRS